ncbi:MAG: phosphatase PAP2 family protein, partial [Actinomycetota bacterium]|nr:phosphatase PAP2 family protein [Actinomycetota bacterium]
LGLVRALAPFIAGSSGMRYRAFLPYSVLGTGLWAATFTLLGYFLAENIHLAEDIAGRGIFIFGAVVGVVVGTIVAFHYLRNPANRAKLVTRIESYRVGRPAVELGRRVKPQAMFLWRRVTPGNLGLEFTTLMAILAVALFIVIGYGVMVGGDPGPTPGDRAAFDIRNGLESGWLTDLNQVVTKLGSTLVILLAGLAATAVLAISRRWAELAVLAAALLICFIAVPSLKELLDRPRPDFALTSADGASWPSGHATYAVLYPWLALVAAVRLRPGMGYGTALIVAGVALAAAIGLSRVYLRVHYLSDVNAGAALGVAVFAACSAVALLVVHFRQNAERP